MISGDEQGQSGTAGRVSIAFSARAAAHVAPGAADPKRALDVRRFLPQGEIDVVVGSSLTDVPYETIDYRGRKIRVETSAEIIAKKMWHRGDRAKGRDLFDLCAVAAAEPEQLRMAQPFIARHGAEFLQALVDSEDVLRREFTEIDVIGWRISQWFARNKGWGEAAFDDGLSRPIRGATK